MHRFNKPSSIAPPERVEYWEADDSRPLDIGLRVAFFDVDGRYQAVRGFKLYGEIVEMGPQHVRLKLDDGRRTNLLRRTWVYDESEPVVNQMQELVEENTCPHGELLRTWCVECPGEVAWRHAS